MQGLRLDSIDWKMRHVMAERMGSSERLFCGRMGVVDGEMATVIDLGLEVINSVIEPGEVLPDVIGIDLVLVGELRDHHVVGVESTLHHPLSLEDLFLHCFEPRLHASGLPGPLNITDMQHPLTHINRLRVL
ncbi:DNA-directed RNA polymerase subunit beta [Hordeum vulgare]|nr:DNA-directed RNA polymerase subunit beta [Hordeum vulgare]